MSLSLVSSPYNIENNAVFEISTDLIEDSTHVNLRIRAQIYHEGIVKAIVEKPKGLNSFDFSDILKSLTPGLKFARDSGDIVQAGTAGANLLTDFTTDYSVATFTGNIVTEFGEAALSDRRAISNAIPMVAGQMYVFYVQNYVNHFPLNPPMLKFYDDSVSTCDIIAQGQYGSLLDNKSYLIMCVKSGNFYIALENSVAGNSFGGDFYLKHITTDRTATGTQFAVYYPLFSEVWEDALGVTTFGATSLNMFLGEGLFRYIPAKGDGIGFDLFHVLKAGASKFANQTFQNSVIKFFTYLPNEYWICFFTDNVEIELYVSKNGASYTHSTYYCYEGWGAVILNVGELMSGVTSSLRFYFMNKGSAANISEVFTVVPDTSQIDERVILEYDGILGGKEYLAFAGKKQIKRHSIRNYRTGSKKGRKPLAYFGVYQQSLETRFGSGIYDMANASYLVDLLDSENVRKLLPDYATPVDVTIVTDDVITESSDMFTNPIEIEYED